MEKYREIKGRIGDAMDAARLERGRIAAIAQTDDYGDADTAGYTADAILQRTALDTMIDYLQEAYELAGALDVHERELDVN